MTAEQTVEPDATADATSMFVVEANITRGDSGQVIPIVLGITYPAGQGFHVAQSMGLIGENLGDEELFSQFVQHLAAEGDVALSEALAAAEQTGFDTAE